MKRKYNIWIASLLVIICAIGLCDDVIARRKDEPNNSGRYNVIAYISNTDKNIPDASLMTHIFTSQGGINSTFDGVEISDTSKLRVISRLKEENPELKVSLSIAHFRPEGWSEMAGNKKLRKKFAESCKRIINDYNLDGIDMDWEFPTTSNGGLTSSPDDAKNYALVAKELRKAIGKDKLITIYSHNRGYWIDFKSMLPYLDYVMVSGYNFGKPPVAHQSNLYPSDICGRWSVSRAVQTHIDNGVPRSKIMVGVPFYGWFKQIGKYTYGERPNLFKNHPGLEERWDDEAKAPYCVDSEGEFAGAFDDERSIAEKGKFIKENRLAGGFYWHAGSDEEDHPLGKAMKKALMEESDVASSRL